MKENQMEILEQKIHWLNWRIPQSFNNRPNQANKDLVIQKTDQSIFVGLACHRRMEDEEKYKDLSHV